MVILSRGIVGHMDMGGVISSKIYMFIPHWQRKRVSSAKNTANVDHYFSFISVITLIMSWSLFFVNKKVKLVFQYQRLLLGRTSDNQSPDTKAEYQISFFNLWIVVLWQFLIRDHVNAQISDCNVDFCHLFGDKWGVKWLNNSLLLHKNLFKTFDLHYRK